MMWDEAGRCQQDGPWLDMVVEDQSGFDNILYNGAWGSSSTVDHKAAGAWGATTCAIVNREKREPNTILH